MLTTSTSYKLIAANLQRSLATIAAKPVIARESAYYLKHIGGVKSLDDFLKNDRLYAFAMKAFGLGDMTYAKAFMRKALSEGTDARDAFVNQLSDKRYRDFVETFNFVRYGEATTAFDRTQQGTIDKYLRQTLEEDAGATNEGVRLALYFERKSQGIGNAYQLLADKALLQVVQTALGISPTTSLASIDTQAKLIEQRLDIADLKDPDKLKDFLTRFTHLWEARHGSPGASASSLLLGQPIEVGISTNLLMSLQTLRLGGR